jgi:hypothetical protein
MSTAAANNCRPIELFVQEQMPAEHRGNLDYPNHFQILFPSVTNGLLGGQLLFSLSWKNLYAE